MSQEPSNKTAIDAFERLSSARLASLVRPTPEYLQALKRGLRDWIERIEKVEHQMR